MVKRGEGVSPSPMGEGSGEGAICPSPENFSLIFVENTIF